MFNFLKYLFSRELPKVEPLPEVKPTYNYGHPNEGRPRVYSSLPMPKVLPTFNGNDYIVKDSYVPPKIHSSLPVQYALAFVEGKPVLMGKFIWSEGFSNHGHEWRELEMYTPEREEGPRPPRNE